MLFSEEIRLALLLLLNAAVLAAAWFPARRWTADLVQRFLDTLLVWFAIQYAAVAVPGVLHILSPISMAGTALLLSAGLFLVGRQAGSAREHAKRPRSMGYQPMFSNQRHGLVAHATKSFPNSLADAAAAPTDPVNSSWIFLAAGLFVVAMVLLVAYRQAHMPILDSDALTYHMPAAVHWLQTGKLDLLPVWFFNPANTFSPLAGSTFIAWLIAPLGNDALARAVQCPAVLLLFLAALQLGRAVGLSASVTALVAVAVTLARPFTSELMSARDDVFLAAFIAVAVAACGEKTLRDPFAPWRLGLAIGLAAATKYTFFFAAPLLLLIIDAPVRAGWKGRHWCIAILTALVIAGPWYARNLFLTGNPLYPLEVRVFGHRVLRGLFVAQRSERLGTWAGINRAIFHGFHAQPALLWSMLAGWLAAAIGLGKEALRTPLVRASLLGLPICVALFLLKAPYGEVRFLFPILVPTFAAVGLGICRWIRRPDARVGVAAVLPVLSILTLYQAVSFTAEFAAEAALLTAIGLALAWGDRFLGPWRRRAWSYAAAAVIVGAGMFGFVYWHRYLVQCEANKTASWQPQYPHAAAAWEFVAKNVPAEATIAYTNTYLIYPLYGSTLQRRLLYVPASSSVTDFLHLPEFPAPLPGEKIERTFTHLLHANPNADEWQRRMLRSGAEYFFVDRTGPEGDAPEMEFAERDPAHFTRLFRDEGAAIYQLKRGG